MKISEPRGRGRITHVLLEEPIQITSALVNALNLTAEKAEFLINLGSVYKNEKRATLTSDLLPNQTRLRVHLEPLRFDVSQFDWNTRIVFENSNFIIVDKPSGIPTHATVDNIVENLKFKIEVCRKIQLHTTHRLDILTQGLILFAKTKEYQKIFNQILASRSLEKIYEAGTKKPLQLGILQHFMKPSPYSPKELSNEHVEGWLLCQLEVLNSTADTDCYRNKIRLLTGRTHQIRSQLAKTDNPIIGDPVYGVGYGELQLKARALSFRCPISNENYSFSL